MALEAFVDAFLDKDIQELDFSDNAFGPAGAKPLMKLLTENRSIRVLKLNNNGLGIGGGELIASALVEAQKLNEKEDKTSNLQVIQMGRNRLESPGAEFLSRAFEAHQASLEELRLYQNSIRPDVFPKLMKALSACTKLTHLDLQDNTLTESGSEALASALTEWKDIKILNIGECLLRPKGAASIFKVLTEGHALLERLYLSFNEIDQETAELIPAMLKNKKDLILLELNGNEFNPEGRVVKDIQDILRAHDHGDALDELDEMEYESEEEEEEEEIESEPEAAEEEEDELTKAVKGLSVSSWNLEIHLEIKDWIIYSYCLTLSLVD